MQSTAWLRFETGRRNDGRLSGARIAGLLPNRGGRLRRGRVGGARARRRLARNRCSRAGRAARPLRLREAHTLARARPDRRAAGRVRLLTRPRDPRRRGRVAPRPTAGARRRICRRGADAVIAVAPLALLELARSPWRTLVRALTLAAAVGLLGAMLLFVGHSLGTMTGAAVRSVPLDWQGPVGSYRAATSVAAGVARQPGLAEAVPTATAPFAGLEHTSPTVGTIRSGAGSILAVPPGYLTHLHTFRLLRGSQRPDEIVLDQQLAATLHAQPGDTVLLTPKRGARAMRLRVSGVGVVTAPDVLFEPLNPLLGPAPAQPPANIAILPLRTFAATVAPALPSISSAAGASAVPGSQTGTQWQVQAQ